MGELHRSASKCIEVPNAEHAQIGDRESVAGIFTTG